MKVDMSPGAISTRLNKLAKLTDLKRERRLYAKIDMSPAAVSLRLRKVSQLTSLCLRLSRHSLP